MNRFSNHVVIVTGGISGIGRSIADRFRNEGARVAVLDIDPAAPYVCDATDESQVREAVACVVADLGVPTILVNNTRGGSHGKKSAEAPSWSQWEAELRAALGPAVTVTNAALPYFLAARRGAVVNIGSVSARVIGDETVSYHAAKAALVHYTRTLAADYGPHGIRANCVSPGFIVRDEHRSRYDDPSNARYRNVVAQTHPLRREGHPNEVASAVLFLASDEASYITGQDLLVDGGLLLGDQFALGIRLCSPE